MSSNGDATGANVQGLNADAATQSNLWGGDDERHDDGYRRDQFGNRIDDDGDRVDPEGRPIDASGDAVNEDGQRLDDQGRPIDDGDTGIGGIIPPIPPMMGR